MQERSSIFVAGRRLDKSKVRSSYLQKRADVSPEELRLLSVKVQEAFIATPEFQNADSIALYSDFRGEVSTGLIASRAGREGKSLAYPKVMGHDPSHLAFFKVQSAEQLIPGAYGIGEPGGSSLDAGEMDIKGFDCIVVPGVAFDIFGFRLGYGKGFYDRQLSFADGVIVALAYDLQIMKDALPVEPHDVRMDVVVTDKEVFRF